MAFKRVGRFIKRHSGVLRTIAKVAAPMVGAATVVAFIAHRSRERENRIVAIYFDLKNPDRGARG